MRKVLLPIVFLASLFFSCQKPVWVRSDTLEHHQWKMTSYSENGKFLDIPECEQEQTYAFYNNGTGIVLSGAVKCDSPTSPTDTLIHFGWSVDGDQYHIFLTHFGNFDYNPIWFFVKFSETSFEVTGSDMRNDTLINYDRAFQAIN
jgi:hypothetical protein